MSDQVEVGKLTSNQMLTSAISNIVDGMLMRNSPKSPDIKQFNGKKTVHENQLIERNKEYNEALFDRMELMQRAASSRIATGNVEQDIAMYQGFQNIARILLGMLEPGEEGGMK